MEHGCYEFSFLLTVEDGFVVLLIKVPTLSPTMAFAMLPGFVKLKTTTAYTH